MSFLVGTLFLESMSFVEPGSSDPAPSIERIVVVLGEKDAVASSRVLRQLNGCTSAIPTAIVSFLEGFRVEQDFTTGSSAPETGVFTLAARLPPEATGRPRSLVASLNLLAEALAPVGPTTAIVLVSPSIGAEPGVTLAPPPSEGEPVATTGIGFETVAVPRRVYEARKALWESGFTVVAVNTSGAFDAGVKALTEIPKGRYLRYSQKGFAREFPAAVCAAGR